jgi:hypothetical protein
LLAGGIAVAPAGPAAAAPSMATVPAVTAQAQAYQHTGFRIPGGVFPDPWSCEFHGALSGLRYSCEFAFPFGWVLWLYI